MTAATYSWRDLAGLSMARQFPVIEGRDKTAVAETVALIGPIQAQTARAPFLGLAARLPGVTCESISTAYDDLSIVRGSNIRGTVHTSTAPDHALLEAATRVGLRAIWKRTLKLDATTLEQVWESIEQFAGDDWHPPDDVRIHLARWIERHDPGATPDLASQFGRFLAVQHGGLLRRPLSGGWPSQGAPGYRSAASVLGDRTAVLADVDGAIDALVRRHLSAHGPASRHDIAWWSGVGLRKIDAALDRMTEKLTQGRGPDDRTYHDLLDVPAPIDPPTLRLLPEFDALVCGYDPAARGRFVTAEHHQRLWPKKNGLSLPPLLSNGRITGYWRLTGSGDRRTCEVTSFPGTKRPTRSELAEPIASVEAAYGITITDLTVTRDAP